MFKLVIVSGKSMEPTLHEGQVLLVLKTKRVRGGDVVVLKHPNKDIKIVKRLLAADDKKMVVAGDNAANITDSQQYGAVDRELLVGRAVLSISPLRRLRQMLVKNQQV